MPKELNFEDAQALPGHVASTEGLGSNPGKTASFELFKLAAERAIRMLGLADWNIEICQAWLQEADEECRARTWMNWTQRAARINWNENHRQKQDAVIEQTPEQYALHEVLHIAINPLVMVALERREHGASEIDAEEHALIRRLMRNLSA